MVPRVASRVGDHSELGPAECVGDQSETRKREDRFRSQDTPRPNGHRCRANSEDRSRALAKYKCLRFGGCEGQLREALENPDASLVIARAPLRAAIAPQRSDLHSRGRGVEDEEGGVGGQKFAESRHFCATKRRAATARKRAESVIDRHSSQPTVDNSLTQNQPANFAVNVQLNNVSPTRKSLVVTLDPSEVDAEHQAVVGEISKVARIPGFRAGKAPAAMVAKRFSKEIGDDFKQKVIAKAYRAGLEKEKLDVINVVNVEEGPIATGTPASVTITLDVRPEFELPDYENLTTEIAPTEVTDAEVEKVIEGLRSERADFKPADRAAQKGDYVKLAYEGKIDGQPITDLAPDKQLYGKVPQTWEEVEGANEGVIPGLGKQLAGLKTGEKKDVTIAFPAEFPAVPALAGKSAVYTVEAQEIRERVLPELNEEFFKSQQVDDLAGLQSQVRNNLKMQKEHQNRSAQRRQVTEQLAGKVDFPVPDSLVEAETQSVLRQFIEENMRRGVPQEQFEKDKKELFEGAKKAAAGRVKMQLVLAKIAEKEKVEVTNDDLNNYLYREAMRSGQKPDKLAKSLAGDRDQLRSVQQSIIFDKAVDFLVSKAKVSTVQPKA